MRKQLAELDDMGDLMDNFHHRIVDHAKVVNYARELRLKYRRLAIIAIEAAESKGAAPPPELMHVEIISVRCLDPKPEPVDNDPWIVEPLPWNDDEDDASPVQGSTPPSV